MGGRAAGELRIHGGLWNVGYTTRCIIRLARLYYLAWLATSPISYENPTRDAWLTDEIQARWGKNKWQRGLLPGELRRLSLGEIAKDWEAPILSPFVVVRIFRWEEDLGNGRRLVTKVLLSSKE